MQVEHKTEKGTVLFVKVPDDAKDFVYFDDEDMPYLSYLIKDFSGWLTDRKYLKVCNGFQLIGLTSEVTEEQAKMMVPLIKRVYGQSYYDYTVKFKVGYGYVGTALESFKSFIKDNEIYEVNHLGEKPAETFNHPDWEYKRSDWNKAQETVGKWIVLFKPND